MLHEYGSEAGHKFVKGSRSAVGVYTTFRVNVQYMVPVGPLPGDVVVGDDATSGHCFLEKFVGKMINSVSGRICLN